jgi:demethylmenaquinone methyltransferase / 2-methoxy-6-polyprenyl-1,4-benzoquinol methylase
VTRAQLDKQPFDVARMFDDVAAKYDVTNDILSLGQDRRWRQALVEALGPQAGERVLDLAAGTGTSSEPLGRSGAFVVPCDFSQGMLAVGKQRRPELAFVAGDGLKLPFADSSFDGVTISFGLRNLHDTAAGLAELLRVNSEYLMRALPPVARAVSSNPEAYVYLAESIRDWPDQSHLAALMQRAGWSSVAWRNLSGGIVALHRAVAPWPASPPPR